MGFLRNQRERERPQCPPAIEEISRELHRLKLVWAVCCTSPIVYLALAKLFLHYWFVSPETRGLVHLSQPVYEALAVTLGGLVFLGQIIILIIRRYYRRRMLAVLDQPCALVELYGKCTIILLAVSETAVLFGFILFLLQGDLRVILPFGMVGLIYYGQSYPSRYRLVRLASDRV